jgi:hypothetical protein
MRVLPEPFETLRRDAGIGDAPLCLGIVGALLVPGLLGATETVAFWRMAGQGFPLWRALLLQLPQWMVYAVATPFILWMGERVKPARAGWGRALALHLLAALVIGGGYALVAAAGSWTFTPFETNRPFGTIVVGWYLSGLPVMVLAYVTILGGGWAAYWFARHRTGEVAAARLEAQLADARLAALRMQLHPHFLFNSLNGVTVLLRDGDRVAAERAVHLLAELLRETLRTDGPDRVPLGREVSFLRRYLELEGMRFSDRLQVTYRIPPELEDVLVPTLLLQPLVENALRHGVARNAGGGKIEIQARADGGTLHLAVTDDGAGPAGAAGRTSESGAGEGRGLGLSNVAERLRVLHGAAAGVSLQAGVGGGAMAAIHLPLERGPRGGDPREPALVVGDPPRG